MTQATNRRALVIGSGIGGLSLAIRLSSMGFRTTVLEKLDGPGGRAYVRKRNGFVFDMGPTVLTVPHFLEELFSLEVGRASLDGPDFPPHVRAAQRGYGPATQRYVDLVPIEPFYRIYFADGRYFDYDGDPERTRAQIRKLAPQDLEGYERFHEAAKAIFERGFLELGYTHFDSPAAMLRVMPDLVRLDALRPLFDFVARYFQSDEMRAVFSFEPLLIGGNPLAVPAIYTMIHFVEKTWGVHFARGGTGALVRAMVKKLEELGGDIRYESEVRRIDVEGARPGRRVARGVTLASGERIEADLVASNADYVHTYGTLLEKDKRVLHADTRLALSRASMSVVVVYFGFRQDGYPPLDLRHHNIVLGPRYEELLRDIFDRRLSPPDFSQYLHVPTLTDPSLAPPGHHTAYTLVPVPNLAGDIDWDREGPAIVERALEDIERRGLIPDLRARVVEKSFVDPRYFEKELHTHLGSGFGLEPVLRQTAWMRPHLRSEDVEGLYCVGQSYQPGGGTPSVMMSAKMAARAVADDYRVARHVRA
ncbi:MAG: phytoene desaturase family protein [Sandaracinus sp.]